MKLDYTKEYIHGIQVIRIIRANIESITMIN